MGKKITSSSEAHKVYQEISAKILSGEFPSGHRLVESDLAAKFGVSRTPVRLAIERLVSENLARHEVNRGAVVRQMTIQDIRNLFSIREVNEGLAARLASQHVDSKDDERFFSVLKDMEEALNRNDLHTYYDLSGAIHQIVRDMADNEFLNDFLDKIYVMTYRYHINIMLLPGRAAQSYREHQAIVEAVLSQDGDRAEKAMIDHIKTISSFYNDDRNRVFFSFYDKSFW